MEKSKARGEAIAASVVKAYRAYREARRSRPGIGEAGPYVSAFVKLLAVLDDLERSSAPLGTCPACRVNDEVVELVAVLSKDGSRWAWSGCPRCGVHWHDSRDSREIPGRATVMTSEVFWRLRPHARGAHEESETRTSAEPAS